MSALSSCMNTKQNYRSQHSDWVRKNISKDILEALVYKRYAGAKMNITKTMVDNGGKDIIFVYQDHAVRITNSEWGAIERVSR